MIIEMQTSGQFRVVAQGEVPHLLSRVQTHHMFNLSTTAEMGALSSSSPSSQAQHLHEQQVQVASAPHQSTQQAAAQSQQQQSIGFAQDHISHPQQHHVNAFFTAGHQQQQQQVHQLHQNHALFRQNHNGFTAGAINTLQLGSDQGQLHHLHQSVLQTNSSPQEFSTPNTPHFKLTLTNVTTTTPNTSPNLDPTPNPASNPRSRFAQSSAVGTGDTIRDESHDDQIDEQDMEDKDLEQKSGRNEGGSGFKAAGAEATAAPAAPGTRWPRQEAVALLKIRADMDAQFRDSSLKGPLWEEISRQLTAMGYHRSAKKCKEKFENVHKYYKRTRDGKVGRQDGKSYRFFSQLEALYGKTKTSIAEHSPNVVPNRNTPLDIVPLQRQGAATNIYDVRSTSFAGFDAGHAAPLAQTRQEELSLSARQPPKVGVESPKQVTSDSELSTSGIDLSSDSSGYDDDNEFDDDDHDDDGGDDEDDAGGSGGGSIGADGNAEGGAAPSERRKRKHKASPLPKKYLAFFENAMQKVLQKQEEIHQKFLEALEKRERDRMIREEAWKRQEMARLSREQELWTQERALAASRDATLVAFLQKVTGHSLQFPEVTPFQAPTVVTGHPPAVSPQLTTCVSTFDSMKVDYSHYTDKELQTYGPNSKRWPKPEVLALIKLRTDFDQKFHDSGSKSQLWEDISAAMVAQGFNRPAKRCKEKWENINKYFKKAKESNKTRPEDSKTCPYYHYLDALYKEGLLGCSSAKQLSDKGEDQSASTTVGVTKSIAHEDVLKVAQVQEVHSQALASVNVQGSQGDKTTGVSGGLPSLVSVDISVKKILTNESSGITTTSMRHPLERVSSSKGLLFGFSKSDEQPQLKNAPFGSTSEVPLNATDITPFHR